MSRSYIIGHQRLSIIRYRFGGVKPVRDSIESGPPVRAPAVFATGDGLDHLVDAGRLHDTFDAIAEPARWSVVFVAPLAHTRRRAPPVETLGAFRSGPVTTWRAVFHEMSTSTVVSLMTLGKNVLRPCVHP